MLFDPCFGQALNNVDYGVGTTAMVSNARILVTQQYASPNACFLFTT